MAKSFEDLSEREILALAVSLEEEDGRIYGEFAEDLRENYTRQRRYWKRCSRGIGPSRESHRALPSALWQIVIPFIRRHDVKGFVSRPSLWLIKPVGPKQFAVAIESMEGETGRFYQLGAQSDHRCLHAQAARRSRGSGS